MNETALSGREDTANGTESVSTEVELPHLGEGIVDVTVTRWLKQAGDTVDVGEPLLEVATDKVDTEIVSTIGGVVESLLASENEAVRVGDALAIVAATRVDEADLTDRSIPSVEGADGMELQSGQIAPGRGRFEPMQEAPDAQAVSGSAAPTATSSRLLQSGDKAHSDEVRLGDGWVKLPRIRQTIARRMVESLQTSAQLTTVVEVDVTSVAQLRARHKDEFLGRTGTKLTYLPFVAKATVEALLEHRVLNASVDDDVSSVLYHRDVNLGIAVDAPKGLMVPVVSRAQDVNITGLALRIADLADRVRSGRIKADELSGGTFTITNTGSRGALFDTPIINQPQTGILGCGAVVDRVVPLKDSDGGLRFDVKSMMYLSISYDHRIVDGADAARFLGSIKLRIEEGFEKGELL